MKVYCKNCKFFSIHKASGMPYTCDFFGFQCRDYPPEKILYTSTGRLCDQGIKIAKSREKKEELTPEENSPDSTWRA